MRDQEVKIRIMKFSNQSIIYSKNKTFKQFFVILQLDILQMLINSVFLLSCLENRKVINSSLASSMNACFEYQYYRAL